MKGQALHLGVTLVAQSRHTGDVEWIYIAVILLVFVAVFALTMSRGRGGRPRGGDGGSGGE